MTGDTYRRTYWANKRDSQAEYGGWARISTDSCETTSISPTVRRATNFAIKDNSPNDTHGTNSYQNSSFAISDSRRCSINAVLLDCTAIQADPAPSALKHREKSDALICFFPLTQLSPYTTIMQIVLSLNRSLRQTIRLGFVHLTSNWSLRESA